MNVKIPLRYALAAAMLSLLFSGAAQAACEWSDRIDKDEAECLSGEWTNRTWPHKDTASVKNECSSLGTVVAKVDREHAPDWTKWLSGDGTVKMSGSQGNVRGIHCCSDLSDLCNRSDIVNPQNCLADFLASEAGQGTSEGEVKPYLQRGCNPGLASATADPANESCTINAICSWWVPTVNEQGHDVQREMVARFEVTVPYVDVRDLTVTQDGQLTVQ